MTHEEKAVGLLKQQYHCSQALVGAFAADFGIDLKTALKISTCFGSGMHQGETCGCLTASMMILGMAFGFYDVQDRELEMYGNRMTDEFYHKFVERMNGKVNCRDILGEDISRPEGIAEIRKNGLIPKICPNAMAVSIGIIEEMLETRGKMAMDIRLGIEEEEGAQTSELVMKAHRRQKFRRNVQNMLRESEEKIAFVQFDISKFKIINDVYGEKIGDEILYAIYERLGEICNEKQYFINLRSDVYMIVTEYQKEQELRDLIENIENELSEYKGVKIHFAFGIYIPEDRNMELRQMEDCAGMARKAVKDNHLVNVAYYKEQFKERLYARKFIEENMEAAITERQFEMYLQPKYSITKNKIVGAEALVRWKHPKRGMIYPNEFIPVMEENGFIQKVDYYIWKEAGKFIRSCIADGIKDCPVSVNVSREHLKNTGFVKVLTNIIQENGIPKSLLELEITESMNSEELSRITEYLKQDGFTLLMDDFGSGYSSLNFLLETPFDVIKLDKKFVDNMMSSQKGKMILEHMVAMANELGLGLLAEGVETKEQVDVLHKMGCDHVQGYYYAKPMPKEEFFELLRKDRMNES